MTGIDTKQRILDVAQTTVQAHGYAGLSFRELAKDVGIKSASIHYYFPSKGELGGALAARYTANFERYLEDVLSETPDTKTAIGKYADVFRATLQNENRMCLGGMMSAEHDDVPPEVQVEVVNFSEMNVRWLVKALSLDNTNSSPTVSIEDRALAIFAAIQGAQLVARGRDNIAAYDRSLNAYRASGLLP